MRGALVILLVVTAWSGSVGTRAQTPEPVDVDALGPQVGERVPEFTATDQHGRRQTLASMMADRGLMLVFFRSADW